jgi:hypothetical protein
MKVLLFAALLQFLTLHVFAQISISNSKWKGQTEVPRIVNIDLEFSKDTFKIFSGRGVEVMPYSQYKDSLFIRKISGNSHEWLENGKKFLLHVINDSCTRRINGIEAIRINQRIRPADEAPGNRSYKSLADGPILLRVDYPSGHGISDLKSEATKRFGDLFSFTLLQTGHLDFQLKEKKAF